MTRCHFVCVRAVVHVVVGSVAEVEVTGLNGLSLMTLTEAAMLAGILFVVSSYASSCGTDGRADVHLVSPVY